MDRNKLAEEYAEAPMSKEDKDKAIAAAKKGDYDLIRELISQSYLAGFNACLSQLSGLENESRSAIACRLILANAKIQELERENQYLKRDLHQQKGLIAFQDENSRKYFEDQEKITELEQQLKKAESVIEKFITKSNGLSIYARSEAERTLLEKHYKDLVGRIFDLYDYQCEVEQYLKSRGEK